MKGNQPWWQGATIYQIYPRSFYDSNGDGIGDLAGIGQKLEYIASLGVDAIWISPFFKSPMKDFGYDISDYRAVDAIFGTLTDCKAMIKRAHSLGLKVIIDKVVSHTSDQHPWFQLSRQDKTNSKSEWYVWADPNPDGTPPTNWQSVFGGSAWEWEPRRKQYYLHNFLSSQPDLNYHNDEVQHQILEEFRFWLDLGIDGFRLDTANYYYHDALLRDNPARDQNLKPSFMATSGTPYGYQEHIYDKNRPENILWLQRMRALLDSYPDRMLVGEIGDSDAESLMGEYTRGNDRLHMAYSFQFLTTRHDADFICASIRQLEDSIQDGWPAWAMSNHDVPRVASRWLNPACDPLPQNKLHLALLLALRGSLCIYNGEELGLTETELTYEQLQDPYGITFWPDFKGRDGCRTPMPWYRHQPHAGFSRHTPWLPVPPEHQQLAVDEQESDPHSMLSFSRQIIQWRKHQPQLCIGDINAVNAQNDIVSFRRTLSHYAEILCVFNLAANSQTLAVPAGAKLMSAPGQPAKLDQQLTLPAFGFAFLSLE
ncbi:alpha-glucosidase [Gynuella sunshinyii]|uniref:Glycosidase n=1 Tax=Gynuella sunshinyii YC6258 TaxID=1445510 RepID=A0A0C5V2S6_9GAMM|nr:alpha-glucosidase [Gynuella sunshinyii]AJQ93785.1 glycosidase [Gynuella sunshinyii YC6258]